MLPDFLTTGLDVVFCGTAASTHSAARGHYYAGPGNEFWPLLCASGFLPDGFGPDDDADVLSYGIGLTDLAKGVASTTDRGLTYDVGALVNKIERFAPRWIAFHGKEAARAAARHLGRPSRAGLGVQDYRLDRTRAFVLPSASGANRRESYDGRTTRLEWFVELRQRILGDATD
jgi:TDG/mug DNA glycosylase family protein